MSLPEGYEIDVVRGAVELPLAAELVAFWTRHGALDHAAAEARASEVVCVLRDGDGGIAAVNSAYSGAVEAIGDWVFWNYRMFAPSEAARSAAPEMLAEARAELQGAFTGAEGDPVGLCWAVPLTEPLAADRAPVWPASDMMFAGRDAKGRPLRISYFPPLPDDEFPLADGFKVRPPQESDHEAIVRMWLDEGALPDEEGARRRLRQLSRVGLGPDGSVCGVSTAYLARNERLGVDLWHIRAFVGPAARLGNLATHLLLEARDDVKDRHASGADRRAPGAVMEIENLAVARHFPAPTWYPALFTFVGLTPAGAHVRVHWFDGAELPPPPG